MGFVSKHLSRLFYHLGGFIAKYPKYFIIVPVIATFVLATGLLRLNFLSNVEYLYTQSNANVKADRNLIEHWFPPNYTDRFDVSRATQIKRFARLLITAKDKQSLLRSDIWEELMRVDEVVQGINIVDNGNNYNYSDLCGRWHDEKFENHHLDLGALIPQIENGSLKLSYPIFFNLKTYRVHPLPQFFGGIVLSNDSLSVRSIEAASLNYFLAVNNDYEDLRGEKWELALKEQLENMRNANVWKLINVHYITLKHMEQEIDKNFFTVIEPLVYIVLLGSFFTILTSMMTDWVRSKPWLGCVGMVSSGLGAVAAIGLVCYLEVPFCGLVMCVPFILCGIGIDDMFVMLAAWRQTSPEDPVPKRLAECYSESAVSITITTLTDALSFYIGYLTPIPTIQFFSLYAGTGVIFIYIWHIFFFGAFVAISGYHEAENRHALLWWKTAIPKSKSESLSPFYRLFFTGGIDKEDPDNPKNMTENGAMVFFRDQFSPFICNKFVKAAVILTFIAYVALSCLGISQMEEGLKIERLVRQDSYLREYFSNEMKYFKKYPLRVQVVVTTPLDYFKTSDQDKIFNLLDKFYALDFVTQEYSENWLRDYTRFVKNYQDIYETNITTSEEFLNVLREEYLSDKITTSLDVTFNENQTQILASRYIIQVHNVTDYNDEKELLRDLKRIVGEEKDLNVTIFNPSFVYTERMLTERDLAIKMILVAIVSVMIVAVLFIPSIVCCLCVLFSIFSIEIGVIGFMSLVGNVSLDIVSIILLQMCIGFSVDFSAHVSYAYIAGEGSTEKRITAAMHSLGLPIVQGALSTIVAVASLPFVPSYCYKVVFQVVVLVIVFATWHALFLLPVLLSIFQPEKGLFTRSQSYALEHPPFHKEKSIGDGCKIKYVTSK